MRPEASDEIDEAAALWAARVDHAPLTPAEADALDAWLAGDTRRLGAYARARAALMLVENARALGPNYDPANFMPAHGERESVGWSRRRMLWLSGSAVAAAGVGAATWRVLHAGQYYETVTGEMRRIALPDGSAVALNTASAIYVDFSHERRAVTLARGEALFEVAKDRQRPFVVTAGVTRVQAIGTAFAVRRRADRDVSVLVREGTVEVARAGVPARVRLHRNMKAEARDDEASPIATSVSDDEAVERQLYWQEGKIALSHTTLAAAATEFARYNDERIVTAPDVGERRISGLFEATDPEGFAEAAALSLGLRVRRVGHSIHLSAS